MVPLSQRRHRIHVHELGDVKRALHQYLRDYIEHDSPIMDLEACFQCYFRLINYKPQGRPQYPEEITRTVIEAQLRADKLLDTDISQLYETREMVPILEVEP